MKIEVYDEKHEPEKVLRLRLIDDGSAEGVLLAAVDKDGEIASSGRLARIGPYGLQLIGMVARDLDLPLDGAGRVKVNL